MSAELVLRNGGFTTLDRSNPSATAVGITAGVFTAVGRDSDVMQSADPDTRIIDLAGQIGHRCAPSAAMRWGDPGGAGQPALHRKLATTCVCASACGIHGHDHAVALSGRLSIADLISFWGALGCACWAV